MRPLLEGGQDTGRDVWCSTDWMVARLIRQGYVQKLDHANIPNADEPRGLAEERRVRPGPRLLAALAERLRRHRLQPRRHRRQEDRDDHPAAHRPGAQGQGHPPHRDARHRRPRAAASMGKDPANFTDADFDAAIAMIQKAKDAGQIKGFTGNDYTDGLDQGRHRRLRRVDRRRRPAAVRQRQGRLRPARRRLHPVVRQLRHPGAGQAQEERRGAHQLLLRPRGHGAGRGLRQLHPAGRRAPRRPSPRSTPSTADNPLIFPQPGRPRRGPRSSAASPPPRRPSTPQPFSDLTAG